MIIKVYFNDRLIDSDISDANNSVDNNEYDYLPGSYQSITMNSNLVNRLPSNNYTNLYQPVSSTQQFNDNDNYVLDNDELDKYDWSYNNINNNVSLFMSNENIHLIDIL